MKKRIVEMDGESGTLSFADAGGVVNALVEWNGSRGEHQVEYREVAPGVYSLLVDGRSVEAHVFAPASGGWMVEIGGKQMAIAVRDPREAAALRSGVGVDGQQSIVSPMPGKVVRVLVEEGASVEAGQGLVVVEAMKMQNELKAPKAGKVVALAAREGASVTAGEVLVTLE
jgi:biotin carboxyl carrier protein